MKPNRKTPKTFKGNVQKTFKQKWNEVDETCPSCGQVTKVNRGLTKQNLKKMFKKPSIQDIIILIMLALVLFGAWGYQNEVAQYKELVENPQELCQVYYEAQTFGGSNNEIFDISNIELVKDGKAS